MILSVKVKSASAVFLFLTVVFVFGFAVVVVLRVGFAVVLRAVEENKNENGSTLTQVRL